MITVKLFGLLRLESGIRERQLQATSTKEVLQQLTQEGIPAKMLSGCVVFVNGQPAKRRQTLKDGDTVVLMPPVAGG